jgi:hypothetical protein
LQEKSFIPGGGALAFPLSHFYAHTTGQPASELPLRLKGADMALYATLKQLGLKTRVKLFVTGSWESKFDLKKTVREDGHESESESQNDFEPGLMNSTASEVKEKEKKPVKKVKGKKGQKEEPKPKEPVERPQLSYVKQIFEKEDPESYLDFQARLEHLLKTRMVREMVSRYPGGMMDGFEIIKGEEEVS